VRELKIEIFYNARYKVTKEDHWLFGIHSVACCDEMLYKQINFYSETRERRLKCKNMWFYKISRDTKKYFYPRSDINVIPGTENIFYLALKSF
jgi:hypothetical protein